MTKALMATDLRDGVRRPAEQPAMNPAGVVWPEWPRDAENVTIFAQKVRTRVRDEAPVVILNKDWKR